MDFTETSVLEKDDDIEMGTTELDTPLAHQAAAHGNVDELTEAIKADPTMLEHQDTEGLTPLAHAVMGEKIESMKLLVKMGASLNAEDSQGRTCLSMAAYQGWHEGVVFLLRNGAKQNVIDKSGRTALHSATYPVDTNVLSALLQTVTQEDVVLQDYERMTALHWACFHNRPKHAQLLLLKGSDPFIQDMDGRTPLHWASQNGSIECVTVLLHTDSVNSLINVPDFSGKSPVHFAAAAGHFEVIRELVAIETCDVHSEDNDERTPLHWAAASGQAEALKTLLDLGVDPNPVDIDEGTPLDYARQSGHKECVHVLEEHLGLKHSQPTDLKLESISKDTSNQGSSKSRNPFGFIVDLFRHRPAKTNLTKPGECENETRCHSSHSDSESVKMNVQSANNSSSVPNSRLSTPVKRQRDSEVIRSMELIQLSREDNPLLQKLKNSEPSLVGDHLRLQSSPGGSINLSVVDAVAGGSGDKLRHVSGESTNSDASSVTNYSSILIRSPPPVIKRQHSSPRSRENSLSPVPSSAFTANTNTWSQGRSEYTRAQIENDAAEILALHNHILGQGQATHINKLSTDVNEQQQCLAEDTADFSHGRKIRLAPLKGPIPRPLSPGQLLNKHLETVRQEDCRENRPLTPPAASATTSSSTTGNSGSSSPQNSSLTTGNSGSSSSQNSSPTSLNKRKKKRQGEEGVEWEGERDLSSASPSTLSSLEQRKAIDKSIRTLLN